MLVLIACEDSILNHKARLNPKDSLFIRPKFELSLIGGDFYKTLNGEIKCRWVKNNNDVESSNAEIWIYKNGLEFKKLEDINPNSTNGEINIMLSNFTFQHLDLCQIYITQNNNGTKWIDSLSKPIFVYDETKTPIISPLAESSITKFEIKLKATIIKAGSLPISELGICYNTTGSPTNLDEKVQLTGPFSDNTLLNATISGLKVNTNYFINTYAKTSNGIIYGKSQIYKTLPPAKPVINTPQFNNIGGSTINISSKILDNGGDSLTEYGFIYNKSGNPSINDNKTSGNLSGNEISATITNLEPMVKYYFAAYAKNSAGTTISEASNATTALPDKTCQISQQTTGKDFNIQIPSKSYYKAGSTIKITMYSPTYSFNQASGTWLYDGDNQIMSFGNWLVFSSNSRDLTLPATLATSNCYNIQVMDNAGNVYVTNKFTVIP